MPLFRISRELAISPERSGFACRICLRGRKRAGIVVAQAVLDGLLHLPQLFDDAARFINRVISRFPGPLPTIRDIGTHLARFHGMKILTIALCVLDAVVVAYDLHQIASLASLWI
jgi:hypothetical protein